MRKNVTLIDFGDLLHYASSIGFNWNQAHEILVNDEVPPMYESNSTDLYPGVGNDYGWSEDSIKIVEGFLKDKNLTACTMLR